MYCSSVTANMNVIIGKRFFWYRYRLQCDRALDVILQTRESVIPLISKYKQAG